MTKTMIAGGLDAAQLIAQLDPAIPLHAAHIADVRELVGRGERYSNEAGDVLRAAYQVVQSGRTEAAPHEQAWIARMTAPAVDLTAAGEQYVIPGCRRDPRRGPSQLGLWD